MRCNEDVSYLKEKNIPALMDYVVGQLLAEKPSNPRLFISGLMSRSIPPRIVIIGPPAGGKGTLCEKIVQKHDVVHISTGDLLRAHVKEESPLGKTADEFMKNGKLVPDHIIIDMVSARLQQADCKSRGWLLDGFPRSLAQADALQFTRIVPSCVLILEVPESVLIDRVLGRRINPADGKVYHMKFNPPPEDLLDKLITRSDDTLEALKPRLEIYRSNLTALEEYYSEIMHKISGDSPQEIFKQAEDIIDRMV